MARRPAIGGPSRAVALALLAGAAVWALPALIATTAPPIMVLGAAVLIQGVAVGAILGRFGISWPYLAALLPCLAILDLLMIAGALWLTATRATLPGDLQFLLHASPRYAPRITGLLLVAAVPVYLICHRWTRRNRAV